MRHLHLWQFGTPFLSIQSPGLFLVLRLLHLEPYINISYLRPLSLGTYIDAHSVFYQKPAQGWRNTQAHEANLEIWAIWQSNSIWDPSLPYLF